MIVGDASLFAIESQITTAYERLSLRGVGFFVIHVLAQRYGVRTPEATALACSFDTVQKRLVHRGRHRAPFSQEAAAGQIADSFRQAVFAEQPEPQALLGFSQSQLSELIRVNDLLWAPDGDEAFDDGSYVLHFDVQDKVRLIAFRSTSGLQHEPETLRDLWLPAAVFYQTLEKWCDSFIAEWRAMPKSNESSPPSRRMT